MNKTWKKAMVMYGSSFLRIPLMVMVSIINTSVLGPKLFGDYKFIETVGRFIANVTSVGFFVSISRLVAVNKEKYKEKQYVGLFSQTLLVISLIGTVAFLIFSWVEPLFFDNNLGNTIRICSFIVIAISGKLALALLQRGLHRIYDMAVISVLPPLFYLILIYSLKNYVEINVTFALSSYYFLLLLVIIVQIVRLRPNFKVPKSLFRSLLKENKTNGRPVYIGSLAGVATTHIAGFSISYFIDNTEVGYYMLAITICNPILVIPSVLGTTFFKQFANMERIPAKVFVFSSLASILAVVTFYLLIDQVVLLFYGEDFAPVIPIAKFLIFGFVFHGTGDLINRFLGSKGLGVILRNAAFFVGGINLFGYIFLVKYMLVDGAILTKILASCLYFLLMLFYYRSFTKKNRNVS